MTTKRGNVAFKAAGREYALALTTNAMCRYQDAIGETFFAGWKVMDGAGQDFDIRRARAMFWAALVRPCDRLGDPDLEHAGELIDDIGLPEAVKLLGQAVALAFPAAEQSAGNAPAPGK